MSILQQSNMTLRLKPAAFTIIGVLLFWILFVGLLYSTGVITAMFPRSLSRLAYGTLGTSVALAVTWGYLKYKREKFRNYGLTFHAGSLRRFIQGFIIGAVIFSVMIAALLLFTDLKFTAVTKPWASSALLLYLAVFPLALMEEVAFRGYPFVTLKKRFGLRITQVIVAIAFALYHVAGGQDVVSSFLGPGVWAFVFGLAAASSGGIAKPLGIHVALNLLQLSVGMKGETGTLLKLDYPGVVTAQQIDATNNVGVVLQLVLLVAALICMEFYLKKLKK